MKDSERDIVMKGIELCRAYFEAEGRPMLKELEGQYPELKGRLAAGLVGQGSECLGFDDERSWDHDFGASFCIWLPQELYARYGSVCQEAYDRLPPVFEGMPKRQESRNGSGRVAVDPTVLLRTDRKGGRAAKQYGVDVCAGKPSVHGVERGSILG